jgi:tRNA-dihydrouridine synthase
MFQILTSERSATVEMVQQVADTKIAWLDLNLGCPSTTVCKNGGGSFLLRDLKILERIVRDVRRHFPRRFTCKVRVGWEDGASFQDTIRLLNDCGVEMITVHGRTREMMYKEPARWEWIEQAVKVSRVPIVGNGDVWSANDAERMLRETGCHAVMVARGALKTPWLPSFYYNKMSDTPRFRMEMAEKFLARYSENLRSKGITDAGLVKQLKSITRYLFDDLRGGEQLRRSILLSQHSLHIFQSIQKAVMEKSTL